MAAAEFTPTRYCPHRWCRRLHLATGVPVLLMLALILVRDAHPWIALAYLAVCAVTGLVISARVHGHTPREEVLATLEPAAVSHPLVVRRGWARLAVTLDAMMFAAATLVVVGDLTWPAGDDSQSLVSSSTLDTVVTFGIGMTVVTLLEMSHRLATRSRDQPDRHGFV